MRKLVAALLFAIAAVISPARAQLSLSTVDTDINTMLQSCGNGCNTAASLRSLLDILATATFQAQGANGLSVSNDASAGQLLVGTGAKAATWAAALSTTNVACGGVDDTAAINAAISGMSTASISTLHFQSNCVVSSTITLNKSGIITCDGGSSTITTNQATGDVFAITANNVAVQFCSFGSSVTRTAGAMIDCIGAINCVIKNNNFNSWYIGVLLSGNAANHLVVDSNTFTNQASGSSIGISVSSTTNHVDVIIKRNLIAGISSGSQPLAGISITNVGDLTLDGNQSIRAGNGLQLVPQSGQTIQLLTDVSGIYDSGSGAGVFINVGTGGTVDLVKLVNTWAATSGTNSGIFAGTAGTGVVGELDILQCTCSNNNQHGILINSPNVTNVSITGGSMGANANWGIAINTSVVKFNIVNVIAASSGQFGPNGAGGILINGSNDQFTVVDNVVQSIGLGSYSGTTGRISDNRGYNPVGTSSGAYAPATTATYIAGISPETNYLTGGTVTAVKIPNNAGTTICTGTPCTVILGPNETMSVTYSAAPTQTKSVH